MMLVAVRVLIINRSLNFLISIKEALEQVGDFTVASFTSADTALEFLKDNPQNVAVVDFMLPDMPGADLILRLRATQPDIAIIVSPNQPEMAVIVRDLNLQGLIDVPCTARELEPVLRQAVKDVRDMLPDTAAAPAIKDEDETLLLPSEAEVDRDSDVPAAVPPAGLPEMSDDLAGEAEPEKARDLSESQSIEFVLSDEADIEPEETPQGRSVEGRSAFDQLAAEEPPMPGLEDSGTVRDLIAGVGVAGLNEVAASLEDIASQEFGDDQTSERTEDDSQPADVDEGGSAPARLILEAALDESTPVEAFSIEELFATISSQMPEDEVGPEPSTSWDDTSERYVREPDFLPEELADEEAIAYSAGTTQASSLQTIETSPNELDTERLEGKTPEQPDTLPEDAPSEATPQSASDASDEIEAYTPVPEEAARRVAQQDLPADLGEPDLELQPADISTTDLEDVRDDEAIAPPDVSDETLVAQLALSLTQASLGLTADATLLTQGAEIVAHAGELPLEDIEDLREVFDNDWDSTPGQSRIRFVTVPSSGVDYMVYSRRTQGDLTLSMIFAGSVPLRSIRRQSNRLVEALRAVPESEVAETPARSIEPEPPASVISAPEDEIGTLESEVPEALDEAEAEAVVSPEPPPAPPAPAVLRNPFSYVWMLHDPDKELGEEALNALRLLLKEQLQGQGWQVRTLDVQEDYVYLLADVPGENPSDKIISDLKRRSAEIIRTSSPQSDTEPVWADSYLVLTPGRTIDTEEIQEFIRFVRE